MLGDAVLLIKPPIYSLVLQLLFESVSIFHTTQEGEDIIYMRRITDISSPFENKITDTVPIEEIFRLETLDIIVKLHCMKEITE